VCWLTANDCCRAAARFSAILQTSGIRLIGCVAQCYKTHGSKFDHLA
jgi:hypothetical protein